MSNRSLLPGRIYRFLYPAINFECLRLFAPLLERQCLVSRVRDTAVDPLAEETLNLRPYTCRGRFLVTGVDLEKIQERSFYVDSMVAVVEVQDHRLARVDFKNVCSRKEC